MSQIKEAIPFASKYFKSIKNTIRNYYIEACGQAERIMEEYNKNKKLKMISINLFSFTIVLFFFIINSTLFCIFKSSHSISE